MTSTILAWISYDGVSDVRPMPTRDEDVLLRFRNGDIGVINYGKDYSSEDTWKRKYYKGSDGVSTSIKKQSTDVVSYALIKREVLND